MADAVYGFDLGTTMGIARGLPGCVPWSATVVLKRPSEHRSVAFSNMLELLATMFADHPPVAIFKEAPFNLGAFAKRGNSENSVVMTYGFHAVLEAVAGRFGVVPEQGHAATVRKHFIGRANFGSTEETKAAIVRRCHLLGLMPKDAVDHNRADALAVHDWGCATRFKRSVATATMHLFGP